MKKKQKNQKDDLFSKEEPPSQVYLQSATKENPISVGKDASISNLPSQSFNQPFAAGRLVNPELSVAISGTMQYQHQKDQEISMQEQSILHQINPRQNIVQARKYQKVVDINNNTTP